MIKKLIMIKNYQVKIHTHHIVLVFNALRV